MGIGAETNRRPEGALPAHSAGQAHAGELSPWDAPASRDVGSDTVTVSLSSAPSLRTPGHLSSASHSQAFVTGS